MGIVSGITGGIGSGLSSIGDMFSSFMHPEKGYEKAAEEMRRMWEEALGYQKPYMEAGNKQLPILTGAESALMNPTELLGKWMGSYETSPFAQRSMQNAKASGMDAASSMGLGGSSAALHNIQQSSSDIMNADRQQYLNDLMQKYMAGVGIGQNIYNVGGATAGNLGKQALGVGENLGQAAYGAANAPGDLLKNLLAMAGKMFMQSQMGAA